MCEAQVVPLALEGGDAVNLARAQEERLGLLRELHIMLQVSIANRAHLVSAVQALVAELTNRLQQPVSSAAWLTLGNDHRRLCQRYRDRSRYRSPKRTNAAAATKCVRSEQTVRAESTHFPNYRVCTELP